MEASREAKPREILLLIADILSRKTAAKTVHNHTILQSHFLEQSCYTYQVYKHIPVLLKAFKLFTLQLTLITFIMVCLALYFYLLGKVGLVLS